jgi:hypothetical protein
MSDGDYKTMEMMEKRPIDGPRTSLNKSLEQAGVLEGAYRSASDQRRDRGLSICSSSQYNKSFKAFDMPYSQCHTTIRPSFLAMGFSICSHLKSF